MENLSKTIGAVACVTTSAKNGYNISQVFQLCTLASNCLAILMGKDKKEKLRRPNSLSFSSVTDLKLKPKVFPKSHHIRKSMSMRIQMKQSNRANQRISPHFSQKKVFSQEMKCRTKNYDKSVVCKENVVFLNISCQSNYSDIQNSYGSLHYKSRGSSFVSKHAPVPMRSHSSLSAQVRPSRLYRRSNARLSIHSKLKAVPIPLSPNCDINQNSISIPVPRPPSQHCLQLQYNLGCQVREKGTKTLDFS
jgi:hypothetical protein